MGLMHFFPRTTATCLGFAFFPNAPQSTHVSENCYLKTYLLTYAAPFPKSKLSKSTFNTRH